MSVPNVRIHITLPANFLHEVDKEARENLVSRSVYIRIALMHEMGAQNMTDLRKNSKTSDPDQEWRHKIQEIKEIYDG